MANKRREQDVARDEHYMRMALALAARAEGRTHPNPLVGAVVVKGDRVIARGYHLRAGSPHAECTALRRAGSQARGAELYVNLEPCNHFGRTPPCCAAIKQAGIRRVVIGMIDPNPLVHGRGVRALRAAGIAVVTGVLEAEAQRLNAPFAMLIEQQRPLVTWKAALTLDGRVATRQGEARWITGSAARREGHHLRATHDAIVVGIGTVLKDNPELTCRIAGGRDPIRVIVDSRLRTPPEAKVLKVLRRSPAPTWIVTTATSSQRKAQALVRAGAEVLRVPAKSGRVSLLHLLRTLAQAQILSLLLEGGPALAGGFWQEGLVDRVAFFIAPLILADPAALPLAYGAAVRRLAAGRRLEALSLRQLGQDLMVTGDVIW